MGMTDAVLFFSYALCFWFGGWLIENNDSYESKEITVLTLRPFSVQKLLLLQLTTLTLSIKQLWA